MSLQKSIIITIMFFFIKKFQAQVPVTYIPVPISEFIEKNWDLYGTYNSLEYENPVPFSNAYNYALINPSVMLGDNVGVYVKVNSTDNRKGGILQIIWNVTNQTAYGWTQFNIQPDKSPYQAVTPTSCGFTFWFQFNDSANTTHDVLGIGCPNFAYVMFTPILKNDASFSNYFFGYVNYKLETSGYFEPDRFFVIFEYFKGNGKRQNKHELEANFKEEIEKLSFNSNL